ncbi:MAG: Mur ligase family protein, partial [Oscillospiraceae bacterium]
DEFAQQNGEKPSAIISSIDTFDGIIKKESVLTTPEAFLLHEHFDNAVKTGINFMEMEVSSQALKYDRVLNVKFGVGVFLNISSDHISPMEHSDFDDYLNSKLKIFDQTDVCVINLDADFSEKISAAAKKCKKIITFGKSPKADIYCYSIKKVVDEIHFCVAAQDFDEKFVLTMPGLFNVENALAAIAVARQYGIDVDIIKRALFKARSSGRMELFSNEDNSKIVIVDYAHNKLSFEKLYESVLEEYKGRKIITVFGCPGGKALNRREELGILAGKFSDKVYLTAEDPGYEEVKEISNQIEVYVQNQHCECHKIEDRGQAITKAISDAAENSIILITGKGNETRQKIGKDYIKCLTDSEYAKQALSSDAIKLK